MTKSSGLNKVYRNIRWKLNFIYPSLKLCHIFTQESSSRNRYKMSIFQTDCKKWTIMLNMCFQIKQWCIAGIYHWRVQFIFRFCYQKEKHFIQACMDYTSSSIPTYKIDLETDQYNTYRTWSNSINKEPFILCKIKLHQIAE